MVGPRARNDGLGKEMAAVVSRMACVNADEDDSDAPMLSEERCG